MVAQDQIRWRHNAANGDAEQNGMIETHLHTKQSAAGCHLPVFLHRPYRRKHVAPDVAAGEEFDCRKWQQHEHDHEQQAEQVVVVGRIANVAAREQVRADGLQNHDAHRLQRRCQSVICH